VPPDILQTLPEDLLRLMGYSFGAYSLGFIDAGRDPIAAVRPDLEEARSEIKYEAVDRLEKRPVCTHSAQTRR
jgi:hypothetical protein